MKETQRTSISTILERIIETSLISDRGPDRDLPVPNRQDARRDAVRVPDGAAAGPADVVAEAGERPDEAEAAEAAEQAVGSAKAKSRGIPAVCTGVLRNSSSDRPSDRVRNCLESTLAAGRLRRRSEYRQAVGRSGSGQMQDTARS